jgi:hypothetical protein
VRTGKGLRVKYSKEALKRYRAAYHNQKSNAKARGIEWQLTFDEWLTWWGDDIESRGSHQHGLQMQRYGDSGPYALGNIKKGYPRQNSATWARVSANRKAEKAKREHEAFLDALIAAPSKPDKDDLCPDDGFCHPHHNGAAKFTTFAVDKRR